MRPWLVWLIGVGLLAAAWVVVQVTPSDAEAERPFAVAASEGEKTVARELVVTVSDPRVGDTAVDDRGWCAESTWLVLDVVAEARVSEDGKLLGSVWLEVDGVRYRASERPLSVLGLAMDVGLPQAGSLAFDLPDELATGRAVVHIASVDENRLDSVIEFPVDLAALERSAEVEVHGPERVRS